MAWHTVCLYSLLCRSRGVTWPVIQPLRTLLSLSVQWACITHLASVIEPLQENKLNTLRRSALKAKTPLNVLWHDAFILGSVSGSI